MKKLLKQEYTVEFKEQVVKHAQAVGIVTAAPGGVSAVKTSVSQLMTLI